MVIQGVKEGVEDSIIDLAKIHNVELVLVFGSRARGDYKRTSDIDLAVRGGNVSAFSVDVEEKVPTLLEFDVVDLGGSVQSELRESIETEAKVLYEKI